MNVRLRNGISVEARLSTESVPDEVANSPYFQASLDMRFLGGNLAIGRVLAKRRDLIPLFLALLATDERAARAADQLSVLAAADPKVAQAVRLWDEDIVCMEFLPADVRRAAATRLAPRRPDVLFLALRAGRRPQLRTAIPYADRSMADYDRWLANRTTRESAERADPDGRRVRRKRRAQGGRPDVLREELIARAPDPRLDVGIEALELRLYLAQKAAELLSPRERQVLQMKYQDLSFAKMSRALGTTPATVRSIWFDIRAKWLARIDGDDVHPAVLPTGHQVASGDSDGVRSQRRPGLRAHPGGPKETGLSRRIASLSLPEAGSSDEPLEGLLRRTIGQDWFGRLLGERDETGIWPPPDWRT